MRVVRIYHAGRDASHRLRDRALVEAGVELTLVVPAQWPGPADLAPEPGVELVELDVRRPGDVNRHTYADPQRLAAVVAERRPDVVDLHEEPVSAVLHQLLAALPTQLATICYSAQNLDKRFPPPFAQWERAAYSRVWGVDVCSRQAASVVAGKGYCGELDVLALGTDTERLTPGSQSLADPELRLGLLGRMVPEKGTAAALEVLAALNARRPARLSLVGEGPEIAPTLAAAARAGLADRVEHIPWLDGPALAELYRSLHWVLVPSVATDTWVEQFGRVVTEGQACGAVIAAYASGSLPEVVADTGVLAPEGAAGVLADAVTAASTTGAGGQGRSDSSPPAGWQELRERGLARAPAFTWPAVAQKQVAFYERVLAAGPPDRVRRDRRRAAVAGWGEPARGPGSLRPFALPYLRRDTALTRAAERVLDTVLPV